MKRYLSPDCYEYDELIECPTGEFFHANDLLPIVRQMREQLTRIITISREDLEASQKLHQLLDSIERIDN